MEKNDLIIRLETPEDYRAVENLTREAFWNKYHPGCSEHYVLHTYRTRPDFVKELDFVMEKNGLLIGHVMFVRAFIDADDGRRVPIMTFGPISIDPKFQRMGYGKTLLTYAMDRAREMGAGALCMEGNILFYGTCGFDYASKHGIRYWAEPDSEFVPYFLLCELEEGFLSGVTGVYRSPEGYFVPPEEVEEFDRGFPPKEKLVLPGQLTH